MKSKANFGLFILMLSLVFLLFIVKNGYSVAEQEIWFEILDQGDLSGYCEEAYLVVKTEADWMNVWERHTSIFMRENREQLMEVDFSKNFVVCAFMGQRPTTGYSIDVERVWTDGERVFVDVAKRGPPEGSAVCLTITYPYVMVLVEKTDMHFVFSIVDENWKIAGYILAEFTSMSLLTMFFMVLLLVTATLNVRKVRNYKKGSLLLH